jgi:hypothetical protein
MKTQSYNVKRPYRFAGKDYHVGERIELTQHQARPWLISGHLENLKSIPVVKKGEAKTAKKEAI